MIDKKWIIGLDFDGTCVTHSYPSIGKDIGAVPVLKKLIANGHKIMLWTMRGTKPFAPAMKGSIDTLGEAINWFKENDIELWGINENLEQKESGWSNSNKQYAQLYIDDAALGCPLIYPEGDRPHADWLRIEIELDMLGLI